jgi:hypothetical protein
MQESPLYRKVALPNERSLPAVDLGVPLELVRSRKPLAATRFIAQKVLLALSLACQTHRKDRDGRTVCVFVCLRKLLDSAKAASQPSKGHLKGFSLL